MDATIGEKRGASYNVEALRSLSVEEILARLSINRKGRRFYCPACQPDGPAKHKTPDLDTRPGRFRCFKCGEHGDAIALAMLALKADFKGACDWLGREFGVPTKAGGRALPRGPARRPGRISPAEVLRPASRPAAVTPGDVCAVFEDLLRRCPLTPEALAYCAGRGWSAALLTRYDVAAIADPARLFAGLIEAHGLETLEAAGLVTQEGGRFLFSFGHKLLFPFYARRSFRVEFLQARRIDGDGEPRYLSARRPIPCLWNDLALEGLAAGSRVHVAEGIPDALTLAGAGLVAVAVLGVQNFRDEMIRELLPFDVVLCGNRDADANKAGQKFNAEAAARFAKCGRRVSWALPPEGCGKDWNDFSRGKR